MTWIEPLEMKTWLVQVLSGTPEIFVAIVIMVIMGMTGYFRMRGFSMFFMLILFFFMFAEVIPPSLIFFVAIIGGLMVGYTIARIIEK